MHQELSKLSKSDLLCLVELINRATTIRTDEEMRNLLLCIKHLIPAEDIVAGLGCMNTRSQVFQVKKIVNVSYSPDWLELYMDRKYYLTDPVLQTHYKHFGTQIWSETYKGHSSPSEKEFIRRSQDFGLINGVSLGAPSSATSGSLFSFAGHHVRHLIVLECLIPHLHTALLKLVSQTQHPSIFL